MVKGPFRFKIALALKMSLSNQDYQITSRVQHKTLSRHQIALVSLIRPATGPFQDKEILMARTLT